MLACPAWRDHKDHSDDHHHHHHRRRRRHRLLLHLIIQHRHCHRYSCCHHHHHRRRRRRRRRCRHRHHHLNCGPRGGTQGSELSSGAQRFWEPLGASDFASSTGKEGGPVRGPKRSHFLGCPLRGFQPSSSYPRATENHRHHHPCLIIRHRHHHHHHHHHHCC